MTDRLRRTALPAALVLLCLFAAPAVQALPVTVNLRVEGPTKTVFDGPSTRRFTVMGTASAAGAATARHSRASAAGSAVRRRRSIIGATLSSRVVGLSAGVRSPGFELRAAPSRRAVGSPVATCDASAPVHSGGTARDSNPTSLATGR